jgi:K+-sensing histidine kinase KdpD
MIRDDAPSGPLSLTLRYGLSVPSIAIATLVTKSLGSVAFPTPLFFAAIVVSTWFGGQRPGLMSVSLATLSLGYYFVPAAQSLTGNLPSLIQFTLPALLTCWFVKKRRDAELSLRAARDELELKVQQRTAELRKEIVERKRAEETVHKTQADLAHVNRVMTMGELATPMPTKSTSR